VIILNTLSFVTQKLKKSSQMGILKLNMRGQLTLPDDLVSHLGAKLGDTLRFDSGLYGRAFMSVDTTAVPYRDRNKIKIKATPKTKK
jgi:bifunctional DNA-binding transcriptional regulator/antitoxin component of YhaV-PrlF toxin-antitoxin module